MSRKAVVSKNYTDTKKQDLLYSSAWKPAVEFNSPNRRPNTRNLLNVKLDEFCRSNGRMLSPDRTDHTSKLTSSSCKECLVLVRMQSNLSQELAEKETRLSKCLRLIDDLIEDGDSLKAKLKILEQENGRLADRLRTSEKSRSDSQLKDLANSRTQHIKKLSDLTTGVQDKAQNKLTELAKENSKLRNRIEQLELDKKIITNLKDEAVKSQEFMEKLYNSFKAKFVEKKQHEKAQQEEPQASKSMERDLKQLRSKCSQLENSVKESLRRHQAQSQSPVARFETDQDDEQKEQLKKKFTELKSLYEASQKSRQDIMLQYSEEISKIKEASSHQGCTQSHLKELTAQLQKWKKLCHERQHALGEFSKQLAAKDQRINQLTDNLEDAQADATRTVELERQLMSLTSELNIVRSENERLREHSGMAQEQLKLANEELYRQNQGLQAEATNLNFQLTQLQFRNRQLTSSEAIANQQLELSQLMLKEKEEALKEKVESDKRRQEEWQSLTNISGRQYEESLIEMSRLRSEVSSLRDMVEDLERQLNLERDKYLKAIAEWQNTFEKMEDTIKLSTGKISELQDIIDSMNAKNIELTDMLETQRRSSQMRREQIDSQTLIDDLIQKDMRISQLQASLKGITTNSTLSEEMVRLQIENDELIREVYQKDLALSELQRHLTNSSVAQKAVMETMETVQSEGECQ